MTVAFATASCRVVDGDVTNPTTDERIAEFCDDVFEDKVAEALPYFYNAYYIARFIQGDAALKVSPEYDHIRTGLTSENGRYSYRYCPYDFKGMDFFAEKGICEITSGRWYTLTITNVSENHWEMTVNYNTVFDLFLLEDDENGISLNMSVVGRISEESSFSAGFRIEDMTVDISHDHIGEIAAKTYYGDMTVNFYDGTTPLKTCTMTYKPGEYVRYEIDDHMTD